jgi:hypothetical protein
MFKGEKMRKPQTERRSKEVSLIYEIDVYDNGDGTYRLKLEFNDSFFTIPKFNFRWINNLTSISQIHEYKKLTPADLRNFLQEIIASSGVYDKPKFILDNDVIIKIKEWIQLIDDGLAD